MPKSYVSLIFVLLSSPAAAAVVDPISDASFDSSLRAAERCAIIANQGGECDPYLRPIKRQAVASDMEDDQRRLLDLLEDPDPGVRVLSLQSLKIYVGRSEAVRVKVLEVFLDKTQETRVRYQAAKTLSIVENYFPEVREALLDTAQSNGEDISLRTISYKSLYHAAGRDPMFDKDPAVKEIVVDLARDHDSNRTLREAAIWALFSAVWSPWNVFPDGDVRAVLAKIAFDESEDVGIRIAALKSLYGAMRHEEVSGPVLKLAAGTSSDPAASALRTTAILLLSAVSGASDDATQTLQAIIRDDPDPQARRAATAALEDPRGREMAVYFHIPYRDVSGVIISDPLDAE